MTSRGPGARRLGAGLALLVVAAGGLWLWKRPTWPQEHDWWILPPPAAEQVREVDVQVYEGPGLLARQVRRFDRGMDAPWKGRLVVPAGRYEVRAFVRWADGNTTSQTASLEVRDQAATALSLRDGADRRGR
jgi:hypothetical protein